MLRDLRLYFENYEQAETLAAQALGFVAEHQFRVLGACLDVFSVMRELNSVTRAKASR